MEGDWTGSHHPSHWVFFSDVPEVPDKTFGASPRKKGILQRERERGHGGGREPSLQFLVIQTHDALRASESSPCASDLLGT